MPREKNTHPLFTQLIKSLILNDKRDRPKYAFLLRKSEATVRSWQEKGTAPSSDERTEILRILGLSSEIFSKSPEEWDHFIEDIKRRDAPVPDLMDDMRWFYPRKRLQAAERYSPSGTHIILLTRDCANDLDHFTVRQIVDANLDKGVGYTWVIPHSCPRRDDLISRTRERRDHLKSKPNSGRVNIMVVNDNDPTTRAEWMWLDEALFRLHAPYPPKAHLHLLDTKMVDKRWEQIYKERDELEGNWGVGDLVWIEVSLRRLDIYVNLLKQWATASSTKWI